MLTVLAYIVTIVIIVAFHEWGHFLAMRAFGVRVLTFSVGFGPRLLTFTDKKGTAWTISAIPLGGYVKPLDRRDAEEADADPQEDWQGEFSGKPAWQRIIVYAAGPAFNLLLAFLIYWGLMMAIGQRGVVPVTSTPVSNSVAAAAGFQAGDLWRSVDGEPVANWRDVFNQLMLHIGEDQPLKVQVREATGDAATRQLPLASWSAAPDKDPLQVLGLRQAVLIGKIQPDSGASRSRLEPGDLVLTTDGKVVDSWGQWRTLLQHNPGKALTATVLRDGRVMPLTLHPQAVDYQGHKVGQLGVYPGGLEVQTYNPLQAIGAASERLAEQTNVIWASLVKLFTGHLSLDTLGGPITIAQAAEHSAAIGLASFMMLLAYLSITLGIINLLPIPMLDGGWIFFGLIEMIRGRGLPERFLMTAQSVGLTLVVSFMALVIYNDLVRQFS